MQTGKEGKIIIRRKLIGRWIVAGIILAILALLVSMSNDTPASAVHSSKASPLELRLDAL